MSGYWNGSGINKQDYSGEFYCYECDKDYELDGTTDDSGLVAYADCHKCGKQLTKELPTKKEAEESYWADYQDGK
jgi:transcription elongation factor Elf1